jgi:hypothetical protein
MFKDPIVEQVRKIREDQASKYDFDLDKIFDQAIKRQKSSKHDTISFMKRKKNISSKIAQQ